MCIKRIILALTSLFPINISQGQSIKNDRDEICESISKYYKDSSLYCVYDTIISVIPKSSDSSIVFAIGKLEIKGISTNFVDVFISKNLQFFRRIRRDTLLTSDCIPCDDPRDFIDITLKTKKKEKQVIINCSYFYNRHQMAGTIYRSFVFDITSPPLWVRRNFDEEYRLRKSSIGKIGGE